MAPCRGSTTRTRAPTHLPAFLTIITSPASPGSSWNLCIFLRSIPVFFPSLISHLTQQ